ncbi:very short patch repair endonuclease [uncultured Jannaschia sp.]|uniref:very short patch repair endonuclease n=1 Tax=uncultured Jannaschia sp. TaxID=293347 RepID=UPI00262A5E57|nr:very short patch repair endonuclease [uncultured Jannaschia sp.]
MAADIVDSATRSRIMSGIRGRNTKPELLLRSALHRQGFRFRLHRRDLPGRPDMVFPKHRAVIFVNGCFWHGHDCPLFRWPKSREDFWRGKITRNIERDRSQIAQLRAGGWRVGLVWECAVKGRGKLPLETVTGTCAEWLESGRTEMDIHGNQTRPSG